MTSSWLCSVLQSLDRAHNAGRSVPFWWRDDDAIRPSPALDRLLRLRDAARVPVALATIAGRVEPDLVRRLDDAPGVGVLVHGWLHTNYAPGGQKSSEFGQHRPAEAMLADLTSALVRQRELFGPKAWPVLVPPWNRLAPEMARRIGEAGLAGWSGYGTTGSPAAERPLRVDTHLDPIAWRGSRSLADPAGLAASLVVSLAAHAALPRSPIGLLTHHLVADEAVWRFTAELLEALAGHPAVTWPSLESVWALDEASGFAHTAG